ncbi:MAG TPA: O-antigen ligase family protein [Candidatus Omnitrophota bacterium]|nr:O-antigen ligase family protein [Candidatus Omnitrophota bacterium]
MKHLIAKLSGIDFRKWAIVSLFILWTSTTFSIAIMEIAFVTTLVFWGLLHLKERRFFSTKIDWVFWGPLALFFLFVGVSYVMSEYPKESFRGLFKIAKPLLAFIMVSEFFAEEKTKKNFELVFAGTFVLVAIDSTIQYIFGKDFLRFFPAQVSGAGLRLVGPFGDFGIMGCYLITVIPIFGMCFFSQFKNLVLRKKSFYCLALAIVGFVLLYLTRTRGAMLALLLSIFLLFIYKRWFRMLALGLGLFLVLLSFTPRSMILHLDAHAKEQSISERLVLWNRAIDVIRKKPVTGTGINTYNKAHAKYDTRQKKNLLPVREPAYQIRQNADGSVSFLGDSTIYTSDTQQKTIFMGSTRYNLSRDSTGNYFLYNDLVVRGYYAHNGYLQLAAEIGLPGIFCFLLFLVLYFRKTLTNIKKLGSDPEAYLQLGMLTGLLAFLIYASADTGLQSPQPLMGFWYMAGVLLARQSTRQNQTVLS